MNQMRTIMSGIQDHTGREWALVPAVPLGCPRFDPLPDGDVWFLPEPVRIVRREASVDPDGAREPSGSEPPSGQVGRPQRARRRRALEITGDDLIHLLRAREGERLDAEGNDVESADSAASTLRSVRILLGVRARPIAGVLVSPSVTFAKPSVLRERGWRGSVLPAYIFRAGEVLVPCIETMYGPEPSGYLIPRDVVSAPDPVGPGRATPSTITPEVVRRAIGRLPKIRTSDGYEVESEVETVVPSVPGGFRVCVGLRGDVGENPEPGPRRSPPGWDDDGWGDRMNRLELELPPGELDPRNAVTERIRACEFRPGSESFAY